MARSRTAGLRRLAAALVAAWIGACSGNSSHKDKDRDPDTIDLSCRTDDECPGRRCIDFDGNLNDVCERGETCECTIVRPGTGGSGGENDLGGAAGTSTSGGASPTGGTGEMGGAGVDPSCTSDEECPRNTLCVDLNGNRNTYCDPGELCRCAAIGGTGGASGSGGAATGGVSGQGGTSGSGGGSTTELGAPCRTDDDCLDSLFCLTSSGLADRSGPPGGLCTQACTYDDDCFEFDSLAYCVEFAADGAESYCVQGCQPGPAGSDCHGREDFACGVLGTVPTTAPCLTSSECAAGQLCLESVCQDIVPGCVPTCGGDFHCAGGQFCSFTNGFCVGTAPPGRPIGALCDPSLPPELDECNGFCLATDDTGAEGTCAAFCSASQSAVGCGWNGSGPADAGCLFGTVLSRNASGGVSLGSGDLMLCGGLCDCNAECPAASDLCMDENKNDAVNSIRALFGRNGYCRSPLVDETAADSFATCP